MLTPSEVVLPAVENKLSDESPPQCLATHAGSAGDRESRQEERSGALKANMGASSVKVSLIGTGSSCI